jgi:hypothetical protein
LISLRSQLASPLRADPVEDITVNATLVADPLTVTIVCAWCRRDAASTGVDDPRAIVGLCDEHVTGFFNRVDTLLESCAALRKTKSRKGAVAEPKPDAIREPVGDTVADTLRKHGGLTLCDACLAAELGWPAARVTAEAEALTASEFLRDQWRCARCGARGVVTRARTRRSRILEKQAA